MALRFNVAMGELDASEILAALDSAAERALATHIRAVAVRAKAEHAYQNQTGNLEASTEDTGVTGRFSDGSLEGGVDATMDYASHVASRQGDFVQAAADSEDGALEARFEAEFARALAGL